jgi:RHS repeat-associated protein
MHYHRTEIGFNADLLYFGRRYYDPSLGRWLTPDPAHQSFSPYAYCGNNPFNNIDPNGEIFIIDDLLIAAAIDALINSTMYSVTAGESWTWSGFGKSVAVGAVTGAVGYTAGALAPAGALWGGGFGAAGGALSGGIFNNGMISGAITDGIMGGYTGYQRAEAMGLNPWTGAEIPTAPRAVPPLLKPIEPLRPGTPLRDAGNTNLYWYTDPNNPNFLYERMN